jgi:hypothetical protein
MAVVAEAVDLAGVGMEVADWVVVAGKQAAASKRCRSTPSRRKRCQQGYAHTV